MINSGERRSNVDYLSFTYQFGNPIMRKNRSFAVLSGGVIEIKRQAPKRHLAHISTEYYTSTLTLTYREGIESGEMLDIKMSDFKR